MEIKTSELIGPALNWAVAKCEHNNKRYKYGEPCFDPNTRRIYETQGLQQIGVCFSPITNWSQGGPIIEEEKLDAFWNPDVEWWSVAGWDDRSKREVVMRHNSYLIAAMRCYVASKLGDVVDVPEELAK